MEKYQVKYTPRINHLKPPPIIGLMIFIMVIPGQKYDELINLRGWSTRRINFRNFFISEEESWRFSEKLQQNHMQYYVYI
jgi:hypothetical protein